MMMLAGDLVARLPLVEMALGNQFAFLEEAQGAVDRRVTDVRIDFLYFSIEAFGVDVLPDAEEPPAASCAELVLPDLSPVRSESEVEPGVPLSSENPPAGRVSVEDPVGSLEGLPPHHAIR